LAANRPARDSRVTNPPYDSLLRQRKACRSPWEPPCRQCHGRHRNARQNNKSPPRPMLLTSKTTMSLASCCCRAFVAKCHLVAPVSRLRDASLFPSGLIGRLCPITPAFCYKPWGHGQDLGVALTLGLLELRDPWISYCKEWLTLFPTNHTCIKPQMLHCVCAMAMSMAMGHHAAFFGLVSIAQRAPSRIILSGPPALGATHSATRCVRAKWAPKCWRFTSATRRDPPQTPPVACSTPCVSNSSRTIPRFQKVT
jgi:hypothetical protein